MPLDAITQALLTQFVTLSDLRSTPIDKQFEHFTAYCIISRHHQEEFDTDDVVIGDGGDIGIDSIAILVNGDLVTEVEQATAIANSSKYLDVDFVFIQTKMSNSFDGTHIRNFLSNVRDDFFLSKLNLPRNQDIVRFIAIKDEIYRQAAKFKRGNPTITLYYACNGNWKGDNHLASLIAAEKQEFHDTNLFNSVEFIPAGASQVSDFYQRARNNVVAEFTFERHLALPSIKGVESAYIGVIDIREFFKIILDDMGKINKALFYDNLRDYQGSNNVNVSIASTIDGGLTDQFPVRNNGVTIVAKDVDVTGNKFIIRDYQIVNGCQTSHVLYECKQKLHDSNITAFVPIKIIYTQDEALSQEITRSTNRQTPVEEDELLALTAFQKNLETFFAGQDDEDKKLYYERRSKQYSDNKDIERGRIITVGQQVKYISSMFLDQPHQSSSYYSTLLQSVKERIFRDEHKPNPYYTSALAAYKFEVLFRRKIIDESLRSARYQMLMVLRHVVKGDEFPDFANPKIIPYCNSINALLWDNDKCAHIATDCLAVVRKVCDEKNLPYTRETFRTQSFTEALKEFLNLMSSSRKS